MAEPALRRSALAAALHVGDFGTVPASGPGIFLSQRRGLALVQLATDAESYTAAAQHIEAALGLVLPLAPNRATVTETLAALWIGPARALIVGREGDGLEQKLAQALVGLEAALTELSHGRSVIRLEGTRLRDLLAKGCGLDFHARAFAAGAALQSSYAGINVLLHARDEPLAVDLYVGRGFAFSLWQHLLEGALEYGCRVAS